MLFRGERLGDGTNPRCDIAARPLRSPRLPLPHLGRRGHQVPCVCHTKPSRPLAAQVDPLDGTTLTAAGRDGAIAVRQPSHSKGTILVSSPCP